MTRRLVPLFLIVMLHAAPALGQEVSVEVIDHGIYDVTVVGRLPAPQDVARERNILRDIQLEQATRRVAAMPGRSFGYRYRVHAPPGTMLTLRTRFPPLTNPETGETVRVQDRAIVANGTGTVRFDGYRFDYGWEMAEGDWVFQILHNGRVLAEERFRVVILMN